MKSSLNVPRLESVVWAPRKTTRCKCQSTACTSLMCFYDVIGYSDLLIIGTVMLGNPKSPIPISTVPTCFNIRRCSEYIVFSLFCANSIIS